MEAVEEEEVSLFQIAAHACLGIRSRAKTPRHRLAGALSLLCLSAFVSKQQPDRILDHMSTSSLHARHAHLRYASMMLITTTKGQ